MEASTERVGKRARVILLVDGRIGPRARLAERLRASGHQVLEAVSSDEALALLNSRLDIDALIARDAVSGSMDGLALADWVRKTRPALGVISNPGSVDADAVLALLSASAPLA